MRLSTKSRYAITAMLNLTLNGTRGPVTLAEISENQNISLSYLEQLFAALRSKGLVRGVRGPGGGYYLGRDAADITVADVICAVDEWVEYTRAKAEQQPVETQCTTRSLWDDLSQRIFEFVDNVTLNELVGRGLARQRVAQEKTAKPAVVSLREQAAA
jgi:Rrf2 family iron-sulfur cluster assembly transcriptional regulator